MSSQRQLRVGEQIRHILSDIFLKKKFYNYELSESSICVSEVRVSPDMSFARVFVHPLGGGQHHLIDLLNEESGKLKALLGKQIRLRKTPTLKFQYDDSYDNAVKINKLLDSITQE